VSRVTDRVTKGVAVGVALLTLIGCADESPPAAPQPTGRETAERERPSEVAMVAWMEGHYSIVIVAHDALQQSDLPTFRSQLAQVQTQALPANSPPEWIPLHEALQQAASQAANVADLDAAAGALSNVVFACGSCHATLGLGPVYPAPAPDDGETALETAMLDHKWVTERLWEGVTGPWDVAWQRGADALAVIQAFGDAAPDLVLTDDLRQREQQLRDLGEEARSTTALDARAALYGRLLSTCGECHRASGVQFEAVD
jgi:cytochrome c553